MEEKKLETATDKMSLADFLKYKTRAGTLCIIRDGGWRVAAAWIDYEDLFFGGLNYKLLAKDYKSHKWDVMEIATDRRDVNQFIKVLYVDV